MRLIRDEAHAKCPPCFGMYGTNVSQCDPFTSPPCKDCIDQQKLIESLYCPPDFQAMVPKTTREILRDRQGMIEVFNFVNDNFGFEEEMEEGEL
jgi:hypothetical protein